MKLLSKILILFLIGIFPAMGFGNNQKRALIIAISHYKDGKGWGELASLSDLVLIKETLKKQGFSEANILTITDANATKAGIKVKIEELIKLAQQGDKIVIHFSGHGQQISDLSGDEVDGKDETIVPYDAPSDLKDPLYRGEKHILDDEINVWVNQLMVKVGSNGHVLLLLDSCHSGTASRGPSSSGVSRGDKQALIFNNAPSKGIPTNPNISDYHETTTKDKPVGGLGKFILFTGASAAQVNMQIVLDNGSQIGSLTYAVAMAFEKMPKESSYQALFAKVLDIMHAKVNGQTPTVEGDKGFQIFNGEYVAQEPFFSVKRFVENGKQIIKLMGGNLASIHEGAKFNFLPIGSQNKNSSKAIARGKVVSANAFESTIELEEGKLPERDTEIWGFQTEQSFGKYKIAVKFGKFLDGKLKTILIDTLKSRNAIEFDDKLPDLEISQKDENINIVIVASQEVYAKVGIGSYDKKNLTDRVLDYGRAKILSSVEIDNPDYKADILMKPAKLSQDANGRYFPVILQDTINAFPVFDTSQQGWITIKNTGEKSFYFTLLDIQPDGVITILYPDEKKRYTFEDVHIDAGKEKSFPISEINPPYGVEKFKLIMSGNQDNFSFLEIRNREIVAKDTSRSRGETNPLETLVKDFTDGSMSRTMSRGTGTPSIPTMGGTASFTFKIAPAKK
jgi:metacaspase-1